MKLPELKIRHLVSKYPVIQAGMGVRVGNSTLASATINLGGFGTIASVGLGDITKSMTNFISTNYKNASIIRVKYQFVLSGGKATLRG